MSGFCFKKMKGILTYIKGHAESTKQAQESLASYKKFGWDIEMVPGVVPATLDRSVFPYPILKNGRLAKFEGNRLDTKISCLFNNLLFCQKVLEENNLLVKLEHDSICIAEWDDSYTKDIVDFCFLSYTTAFELGGSHKSKKNFKTESIIGINQFPDNYPIITKVNTVWKHSIRPPGTAAYILTPAGAKKILQAISNYGLEQSDYIINSMVLNMQYIYPSVATYNKNLRTSHGFKL